ncbi:hypothetical protein PRO82_000692 [Candidatus Protochlamydia amoebophila]|nr:hypothetical protein [Candidatus Protochlamydia amoebophila]
MSVQSANKQNEIKILTKLKFWLLNDLQAFPLSFSSILQIYYYHNTP